MSYNDHGLVPIFFQQFVDRPAKTLMCLIGSFVAKHKFVRFIEKSLDCLDKFAASTVSSVATIVLVQVSSYMYWKFQKEATISAVSMAFGSVLQTITSG